MFSGVLGLSEVPSVVGLDGKSFWLINFFFFLFFTGLCTALSRLCRGLILLSVKSIKKPLSLAVNLWV